MFGAGTNDKSGQSTDASANASGSTGGNAKLPLSTAQGGGTQPSATDIDELFNFFGIETPGPFPRGTVSSLVCFDALVGHGGNGDQTCGQVGTVCTRVVSSSGNQTLYCTTPTTYGDNTTNSHWQARCCQDISAVYNVAPTTGIECREVAVSAGSTGEATCDAQGNTCLGVTGGSGLQSLYCSTPTTAGNNVQNPSWNARCCRNRRPSPYSGLTCVNRRVQPGQTGSGVCERFNSRCANVLGGSGNQSLYCATDAKYGNNTENSAWYARCCR